MGISGLWTILAPASETVALTSIVNHFTSSSSPQRPIRVAVDLSIWAFQIRSGRGGTNSALRTLFYRLCFLWRLGIQAVFVLDGPMRPSWKRGRKVQTSASSVTRREAELTSLITLFGFPVHRARGEAEAECAALQRLGHVDLVLTDDVDAFLFGASAVMRNWTSTTETAHATITRADNIRNCLDLDREGLILIALLSGSDYIPHGVANIGIQTAVALARGGWGHRMCEIVRAGIGAHDFAQLRANIELELATNSSGLLACRRPSVHLPDDFPNEGIVRSYLIPLTAIEDFGGGFAFLWGTRPNLAALATFCCEKFAWTPETCLEKLVRCLFPGVAVWDLQQSPAFSSTVLPGQEHSSMLASANNLADLHENKNKNGEAEPSSQRKITGYFVAAKPTVRTLCQPFSSSSIATSVPSVMASQSTASTSPIEKILSSRVRHGVAEVQVEWSDTFIASFVYEAFGQLGQDEKKIARNDSLTSHSSYGPIAPSLPSQPVFSSTTTYLMSVKQLWVPAGLIKAFSPSRMRDFEVREAKCVKRVSGVGRRHKGKAKVTTLDRRRGTKRFKLQELMDMVDQTACKSDKDVLTVDLVDDSDEDCEVIDLTL
jgi:XPG I-region/XPG N-terminal domain